jgi:hypothetical protein
MAEYLPGDLGPDRVGSRLFPDDLHDDFPPVSTERTAALAPADIDDDIARDIAEIERARAALLLAEPGLLPSNRPPPKVLAKTRPLWLLISVVWLSTALVTLGAAVVISALVG